MRRKAKLFIIYFPVILIIGQVLVNLLYFIAVDWYLSAGFYLNLFFGTNLLFAFLLIVMTHLWAMCNVSRWAAWAELTFAVNYCVVKEDNLYNILFQVIVGVLAIMFTFWHYLKKFPLCRVSLFVMFVKSWVSNRGSCERGIAAWDREVKSLILKKRHQ